MLEGLSTEVAGVITKDPRECSMLTQVIRAVNDQCWKTRVEKTKQLRPVSVGQWASQHHGLSNLRDIREVMTLAAALDAINAREVARAMDILCQRVLAVQAAKAKKGGSWEKAEQFEQNKFRSCGKVTLKIFR